MKWEKLRSYSTVTVRGREHVVSSMGSTETLNRPDPNYQESGKVLCGVLAPGQTLEEWERRFGKNGNIEK